MEVYGKIWGQVSPIFSNDTVEVNYLKLQAGYRSSVHLHRAKSSMFIMLHGSIAVHIEKNGYKLTDITKLVDGQSTIIRPHEYHWFEVLSDAECLEIYWVELDDNDIVRRDCGALINAQDDIVET